MEVTICTFRGLILLPPAFNFDYLIVLNEYGISDVLLW